MPICYGTAWVEGAPIWIDNTLGGWGQEFTDSTGVATKKGNAQGTHARAMVAFCQGPVTSIDYVRRDKILFHSGSDGGGKFNYKYLSASDDVAGTAWSYQPSFTLGDVSTASLWSPLSGETNPARMLAYGHLALMRCEKLMLPGGRMAKFTARVRGMLATYADPGITTESTALGSAQTIYNALPGAVIKDILTSTKWGLGLPSGSIVTDAGSDGNEASGYDRYCHSQGWYVGLCVSQSTPAIDIIKMILTATESALVVSGGVWKVVPYGDTSITRGGYTYTPPSVSIGLTDDDIVLDGTSDPVQLDQVSDEDTRNCQPISYVPGYGLGEDTAPVESMDAASVAVTGLRRADALELPCIRSGIHGQAIAALIVQRSLFNRTTARFSVNWRHPEIEPGDFISLTHTLLGFTAKTFRVLSTEEGPDGGTAIEAAEWETGISVVPVYHPQTADGLTYSTVSGGDPTRGIIIDMASDGVFSASEHQAAVTAWLDLVNSNRWVVEKANALGIDSTAWDDAIVALGTYLNNGTSILDIYGGFNFPSWLATPWEDIAITAATWRTKWDDAYRERNKILSNYTSRLTASIAPSNLSGSGSSGSTATIYSNTCVISVGGGVPGYGFSWAKVSGTTLSVSGQNSARFYLTMNNSTTASAVYRCTVSDAQGASTTVDVSIYLVNSGTAPALAATGSPLSVAGAGDGRGSITVYTDYTTISATGGTSPYTYAWTKVSGDTMTVSGGGTSDYTRFSHSMAQDDVFTAVYRCTVTDNASATVTVDVQVDLTNYVP